MEQPKGLIRILSTDMRNYTRSNLLPKKKKKPYKVLNLFLIIVPETGLRHGPIITKGIRVKAENFYKQDMETLLK